MIEDGINEKGGKIIRNLFNMNCRFIILFILFYHLHFRNCNG